MRSFSRRHTASLREQLGGPIDVEAIADWREQYRTEGELQSRFASAEAFVDYQLHTDFAASEALQREHGSAAVYAAFKRYVSKTATSLMAPRKGKPRKGKSVPVPARKPVATPAVSGSPPDADRGRLLAAVARAAHGPTAGPVVRPAPAIARPQPKTGAATTTRPIAVPSKAAATAPARLSIADIARSPETAVKKLRTEAGNRAGEAKLFAAHVESRLRAAFDGVEALRAEFFSFDAFRAYAKGVADGRVRIYGRRPAPKEPGGRASSPAASPARWKADFAGSPALQAEFGTEAVYLAYMAPAARRRG